MKPKAIKDLVQLSDQDFFLEVSIGLEHILNNAIRIEQGASLLAEHEHPQGYRILLGAAEEEVAKFHILLDAVRCPRVPPEQFTGQLSYFHHHLAKGIYAEACGWRPTTFGQLKEYVDTERQEFYLDGEYGEGIFRNWILQMREEMIYVDYVDTGDGHQWFTPSADDFYLQFSHTSSPALRLAQAFKESGCINPKALALIAKLWRSIEMTADYSWFDLQKLKYQTLEELEKQNLLCEQPQEVYNMIMEHWTFPMYSLELSLAKVDKLVLEELQKRYSNLEW